MAKRNLPGQKIWSKKLNDVLYIVDDNKDAFELVVNGIRDVIYTKEETSHLHKVSIDTLKMVHEIKKMFGGSHVVYKKEI